MKVHRGLGVGILIRDIRWKCMVRAKLRLLKPVLLTEHWLRFRATLDVEGITRSRILMSALARRAAPVTNAVKLT